MDTWYDSIDYRDESEGRLSEDEAGKAMWSAISSGMSAGPAQETSTTIRRWSGNFYFRLAAACLLFMLVFWAYRVALVDDKIIAGVQNEVIEKMIRLTNSGSGPKRIVLSDGSTVSLEPGAVLYYPEHFDVKERHVYLKGNVFFEIARDTRRPFFVHANNIVTRVLGTSFTIRENLQTNSIEVAVLTGIVEVKQAGKPADLAGSKNKVILTQNKTATFYQEEEKLVTGLVEKPKIIRDKKEEKNEMIFNYVERPLPEILSVLEKAYGVKINIGNEKLQNCVITADLSQENTLFAQLEILCESIDARYELQNDAVMLSGKGCELTK